MNKHAKRLELNKILAQAASYAVLEGGKKIVASLEPTSEIGEAKRRLTLTEEALQMLFFLGAGRVEYFPDLGDFLERAEKGATLSCMELISCAKLLRAARVCQSTVKSRANEDIVLLRERTERLVFHERLEKDIFDKILGENELSDHASEKLYSIRREIRLLNERIKERLSQYLSGEDRKYLQDSIITMRADRYVIPVKVEYKRNVKGFIHDRSSTGQTVFIEPEEVLEMNNELFSLVLDEKQEIERILNELSREVGGMREDLERDQELLYEIDSYFARAEYSYRLHCVRPNLNQRGIVEIKKGRHPLLDPKTAVPVSVFLGEKFSFLILSGANTGGKTVTLKMCGLFCLMAACGLFIPAAEGTRLPLFDRIFCDVGDSQSIEENLSTFSSHVLSLKEILEDAGEHSFVLIDEPGGGTDPEEGQALACAVLQKLMEKGCRGIVTTHYSALKEYAFQSEKMENGCMEFDAESLRPLYSLKLGLPGASNALLICSRLGLPEEVVANARNHLSEGARAFEYTVRAAEESRIQSEKLREETRQLKREWEQRLSSLEREEEKFKKERENFLLKSKSEAKRIVAMRTAQAEEILSQMNEIFQKETLEESDFIRARTLNNRIHSIPFPEEEERIRAVPLDPKTLKEGDLVFVKSMEIDGIVQSLNREKGIARVQCGALNVKTTLSDLYPAMKKTQETAKVQVIRNLKEHAILSRECNLIGMTVEEALMELDSFLDSALVQNLSEVRIVHGMGTGTLRKAVHSYLRKHARVEAFRLGKYGEGESGVTIVTLK